MNDEATILYRASKHDCQACSMRSRCCPNTPAGKCRAQSTRALATWRARSQDHGRGALRAGSGRRSRCCSLISSVFSNLTAYVYEAQTVRVTNSFSRPPPRTSERWPNCSRCPARGLHRKDKPRALSTLAPLHRIITGLFRQNRPKCGMTFDSARRLSKWPSSTPTFAAHGFSEPAPNARPTSP